jgi:hypothetical protein
MTLNFLVGQAILPAAAFQAAPVVGQVPDLPSLYFRACMFGPKPITSFHSTSLPRFSAHACSVFETI